jgi:hypothetical protein
MTNLRTWFRAVLGAAACMLLVSAPALAQATSASPAAKNPIAPPPAPPGGLCAPWSSCVAKGTLAAAVLFLLLMVLQFAFQRRGFEKIEHQQGHPEGVTVKKE